MPGTPMRELVGLMWNYLSCATESCATDRHGEINLTISIFPNQSCQIKFGKINPRPSKFGKIDQCGTSQFIFYIGGTYTPSPTCHTPSPTCQKREIDSLSNEQHVLTSLKYKSNTDPK